ncbi:hypothetical protein D3C81_226280 [compost metagenome]
MTASIKGVFTSELNDLELDPKLVKRLSHFKHAFINKNDDHINFFGGNLLGVEVVRYLQADRDQWFSEVLDVDDVHLTEALYSLDVINEEFKRTSDVVNLTSIYLLHALFNSKKLTAAEKEKAMIDVVYMLQVKFITSIFAHYFKFPADKEIAQAVYESLSYKYALKRAGSWNALFTERSKDVIGHNSIHYKTIKDFNDDDAILYMITDIQGRIREVVKKMYAVLIQMRDNKDRIHSTTSVALSTDGEAILKDRQRSFSTYKRYIHSVIPDRVTFIRDEVVSVITDAMHTMSPKLFLDVLEHCSANYGKAGHQEIGDLCDETLLHAFEFLSANRTLLRNQGDLGKLLTRLRSLYMASRMVDPTLLKMRDLADSIVHKSSTSKNKAMQASLRTGLELYIVLRTFTMNYYS